MEPSLERTHTLVGIVRFAFGLLGSSGGLLYLINMYLNRVRVRVSVLNEVSDSGAPPVIEFEAQNIGMTPTSIEPIVAFRGFLPRPRGNPKEGIKMVPYELTFNIIGLQRTLAPFTPAQFLAQNNEHTGRDLAGKLGFMFFKTYTFSFTRGRKCRVRLRSADRFPLSWRRYMFERLHFQIRGVASLPKPKEGGYELD